MNGDAVRRTLTTQGQKQAEKTTASSLDDLGGEVHAIGCDLLFGGECLSGPTAKRNRPTPDEKER